MAQGRAALLGGHARGVCALLTPHGRRRVLDFRVDLDDYGRIRADDPRLPQTCEAMVAREVRDAHAPGVDESWPRDLRRSRFTVVSVAGDRASVRLDVLKPYGDTARFSLRRTGGRWRVDDSDVVPSGH